MKLSQFVKFRIVRHLRLLDFFHRRNMWQTLWSHEEFQIILWYTAIVIALTVHCRYISCFKTYP